MYQRTQNFWQKAINSYENSNFTRCFCGKIKVISTILKEEKYFYVLFDISNEKKMLIASTYPNHLL